MRRVPSNYQPAPSLAAVPDSNTTPLQHDSSWSHRFRGDRGPSDFTPTTELIAPMYGTSAYGSMNSIHPLNRAMPSGYGSFSRSGAGNSNSFSRPFDGVRSPTSSSGSFRSQSTGNFSFNSYMMDHATTPFHGLNNRHGSMNSFGPSGTSSFSRRGSPGSMHSIRSSGNLKNGENTSLNGSFSSSSLYDTDKSGITSEPSFASFRDGGTSISGFGTLDYGPTVKKVPNSTAVTNASGGAILLPSQNRLAVANRRQHAGIIEVAGPAPTTSPSHQPSPSAAAAAPQFTTTRQPAGFFQPQRNRSAGRMANQNMFALQSAPSYAQQHRPNPNLHVEIPGVRRVSALLPPAPNKGNFWPQQSGSVRASSAGAAHLQTSNTRTTPAVIPTRPTGQQHLVEPSRASLNVRSVPPPPSSHNLDGSARTTPRQEEALPIPSAPLLPEAKRFAEAPVILTPTSSRTNSTARMQRPRPRSGRTQATPVIIEDDGALGIGRKRSGRVGLSYSGVQRL